MSASRKRALFVGVLLAWLVLLHVLAAIAVLSSWRVQEACSRLGWHWCAARDAQASYERSRRAFILAGLPERRRNFVLLLGDSRLDGLTLRLDNAGVVNAAIGGQSVAGMLEWIAPVLASRDWCAVVVQSGYNDLKAKTPGEILGDFRRLGELIGRDTPWLLTQPLRYARGMGAAPAAQVGPSDFQRLDQGLAELSRESPAWRYVPAPIMDEAGHLPASATRVDGIHLTATMSRLYRRALRQALVDAGLSCV